MNSNLEKFLVEAEGRLKAATPGPWMIGYKDGSGKYNPARGKCHISAASHPFNDGIFSLSMLHGDEGDANLVASAPTNLAKLLEIVKVQAAALRALGDEIHDEHCDEEWHCNWCEQIMIANTKANAIAGGEG